MKNIVLFFILLCFLQCCQAQGNKIPREQIAGTKVVYDPDGYYYPVNLLATGKEKEEYTLSLGKHRLEYLGISLFEIRHDSVSHKFDYDNHIKLSKEKSSVWLHFEEDFNIESNDYIISQDTFRMSFKDKRIGEIKIEGKFLTSKGPSQDETVEATKTIVLKCKVMDNQKKLLNVSFVYWEGD